MKERNKSATEYAKTFIGKASGELLMHGIVPEAIDPENNLEVVKKHLEQGSGILLFNHSKNDFGMWARFIRKNLTSLDHTTALVAQKYLDPNRGKGSKAFSYFLSTWNQSYGLEALPLVQAKDNDLYPDHRSINFRTFVKTKRKLSNPGNLVAFAPEGTRSPNGQLLRAEADSEIILKLNEKSILIPVAAEFPINTDMGPYIYRPIKVHVGKPFFASEIEEEHAKSTNVEKRDLIMQRMAVLLPETNRGYYNQQFDNQPNA